MLSFYNQLLSNGSYATWLNSEYNTVNSSYSGTKTNQNIGNGSGVGVYSITPSSSSTTVDDSTIQSELAAQIASGHLPAPVQDAQGNDTTYYAVFFPHGVTVTQGGTSSCAAGGFCAYHGTVAATNSSGHEFYYGVHPDMQAGSGCDTGCGSAPTAFDNYTSVASHELTEMVTDPEVGLAANGNGPPLAWYDTTNGEIGDICNAQQGSYTACDGQTYTIQLEFSNAQNNCIGFAAPSCGGTTPDFTIAGGAATAQDGSSATATITTAASGGAGTVALSLSGVPAGVTATLASASVAAGSSTTVGIAVASSVTPGSYSFTVTGTEGARTHTAAIALTVTAAGGTEVLYSDGFESGGWTGTSVAGSGAAWSIVTSSSYPPIAAHGGTHWADFNSYTSAAGTQARFAHSAMIAIPSALASATLTFWVYHDTGYPTAADQVQAEVSTNGSTWTSVGAAVNRYDGSTGWSQATVDLSAYRGQSVELGLLGTSEYGNDLYVDDVAIAGSSSGAATYAVAGTVTLGGSALSGVTISDGSTTALTSSSGAFTLAGLPDGTYTLTPSLSGYTFTPATDTVTVNGASVSGVSFTAAASSGGGTVLSDGFEGGGWIETQVSGSQGAWAIVTSSNYPSISAHGGSHWADFNSYTSAAGSKTRFVRSATVALPPSVTTVTMTYWMYHDTGYPSYADKIQPQVAVGSVWSNLGSAIARYDGATGWGQATVDLSTYKGKTIEIGFLGESAYGDDEYVDDVTITAQ